MSHTPNEPVTGRVGGPEDERSIGEIVSDLSQNFSTLVSQELTLAKAEATQSAQRAGKGVGMLAGAALTAHLALLFLSLAAMWGLGALIGVGWSSLIVAVVYAIVGLVLFLRGRAQLKTVQGLPRTAETVREIPSTLKPGGTA